MTRPNVMFRAITVIKEKVFKAQILGIEDAYK